LSQLTELLSQNVCFMSTYKYRVLGSWAEVAVNNDRIHELLTTGVLSPYDLIQRASGDGTDQTSICRHSDFNKNEVWENWRKLLNVRSQLDELWQSQRDSLLSMITGVSPEPNLNQIRNANDYLNSIRENCLMFWRNEPDSKSVLDQEIKRRHYIGQFKSYIPIDSSFDSLSNWLAGKELDGSFGCYAFFNKPSGSENELCLYIGMTARLGFRQRLKNHFDSNRSYTQNFDQIHFWTINRRSIPGTNDLGELKRRQIRCWILEKLLIKKYEPQENDTQGNLEDPCDEIINIMHSEVRGLCQDGELLQQANAIAEKSDQINFLKREIREITVHMQDTESDDSEDVIISEKDIKEESQSNEENLEE
jgi:hypothetical protein